MPKQPSKTPYTHWTWGGMMSLNNNLCFGAADDSGNASGCWAITLAIGQLLNSIAGAIRYKGQPSIGVKNTTVLIPLNNGLQYYAGWYGANSGGIDILDSTTPTYYSNYESYVETDIIPIGTVINPKNFTILEMKLDTPLTANEKIRISMRNDLNTSYTQVLETTTAGAIDDGATNLPLYNFKWIQFKVEIQTSGSSNSFVRLKQLRIR
jgi:hypothetical protein